MAEQPIFVGMFPSGKLDTVNRYISISIALFFRFALDHLLMTNVVGIATYNIYV